MHDSGHDYIFTDQNTIRANLHNYLRIKNEEEIQKFSVENPTLDPHQHHIGRAEDFIEQFNEGYCSGISSLWLYAKWLQTQPNPENKPRDDYEWFQSTAKLIAGWDRQRKLSDEESNEFERFISHIQYFQNTSEYLSIDQRSLDQSLEDTNERILKKEYSIASLFTLAQLQLLLNTENIIQDSKLITISSHNHATALFKQGPDYFYFDPNNPFMETTSTSSDEIAILIFNANFYATSHNESGATILILPDYNKPSPLGFQMFSFDETSLPYPLQQDVLSIIDPILTPERHHADGYSGLTQAANAGSLESAQYFLSKGVNTDIQTDNGQTALMLAASVGYLNIVNELLGRDSNPDMQMNEGWTALILAANTNHHDIVAALLRNHANPNIKRDKGWTALMMASGKGFLDTVNALVEDNQVDLDIQDDTGLTALCHAAKNNELDVVNALLEKGADPDIADNENWTALDWALYNQYDEIVKTLQEHIDKQQSPEQYGLPTENLSDIITTEKPEADSLVDENFPTTNITS